MRSPREIYWLNNARSGAENLGEADNPNQTCVAMHAGEFKADAEAERLGILQYLYGGGAGPQAQGREAPDTQAMAQASTKDREEVLKTAREHPPMRAVWTEDRAYVENAVVASHRPTEAERQIAGQMGAEFTGPSPSEITEAGGSYQEAADKAAQAQGVTGEPPKPEEPKPPESTPAPRTPPPPRQSPA